MLKQLKSDRNSEQLIDQFYQDYKTFNLGTLKKEIKLSRLTTINIGGSAKILIEPYNQRCLIKTVKLLNQYKVNYAVLGNGSNMLVSDKGYNGVLISLKNFKNVVFKRGTVSVGAGHSLVKLAHLCLKKGLSGLEFAVGIPGTLGGALFMNAGAFNSDISSVTEKIIYIDGEGEVRTLNPVDADYGVRHSVFQKRNWIIIGACLHLRNKNEPEISKLMEKYDSYRKITQPYNRPSLGSVFFPPPKGYAGELIEKINLKGHRIGGIEISQKHGNHFVNIGDANADDFLQMINYVNKMLMKQYGIILGTEIQFLGINKDRRNQ